MNEREFFLLTKGRLRGFFYLRHHCQSEQRLQQQARVQLDIKACKAEEICQEFIEYLSHGQMFDWTGWARTRRESLLRSHMWPLHPGKHPLLSTLT